MCGGKLSKIGGRLQDAGHQDAFGATRTGRRGRWPNRDWIGTLGHVRRGFAAGSRSCRIRPTAPRWPTAPPEKRDGQRSEHDLSHSTLPDTTCVPSISRSRSGDRLRPAPHRNRSQRRLGHPRDPPGHSEKASRQTATRLPDPGSGTTSSGAANGRGTSAGPRRLRRFMDSGGSGLRPPAGRTKRASCPLRR